MKSHLWVVIIPAIIKLASCREVLKKINGRGVVQVLGREGSNSYSITVKPKGNYDADGKCYECKEGRDGIVECNKVRKCGCKRKGSGSKEGRTRIIEESLKELGFDVKSRSRSRFRSKKERAKIRKSLKRLGFDVGSRSEKGRVMIERRLLRGLGLDPNAYGGSRIPGNQMYPLNLGSSGYGSRLGYGAQGGSVGSGGFCRGCGGAMQTNLNPYGFGNPPVRTPYPMRLNV